MRKLVAYTDSNLYSILQNSDEGVFTYTDIIFLLNPKIITNQYGMFGGFFFDSENDSDNNMEYNVDNTVGKKVLKEFQKIHSVDVSGRCAIVLPYLAYVKESENSSQSMDSWKVDILLVDLRTKEETKLIEVHDISSTITLGIINDDKYSIVCFAQDDKLSSDHEESTRVILFDIKTFSIIFETRLSFAHDENPVLFRYDYQNERLILIGYEFPDFEIDLKNHEVKRTSLQSSLRNIGVQITFNPIIIDNSTFITWYDATSAESLHVNGHIESEDWEIFSNKYVLYRPN